MLAGGQGCFHFGALGKTVLERGGGGGGGCHTWVVDAVRKERGTGTGDWHEQHDDYHSVSVNVA